MSSQWRKSGIQAPTSLKPAAHQFTLTRVALQLWAVSPTGPR